MPARSVPLPRLYRGHDAQGAVQLERQYRLGGHADGAAFRQDLRERPSARAGAGTDRRAFSTARDGANDRAKRGSSAGVLSSAPIRSNAILPALLQSSGANPVFLSFHGNGLQVQY